MDSQLQHCLNRLNIQNETLAKVREAYLLKEAQRKHFEATLINLNPIGYNLKPKSYSDRLADAHSSKDYLDFMTELAKLEAELEFQKLKYFILDKEFLAQHLSLKVDSEVIRRG